MKRILIVGVGSYIGTSFEHWLAHWPEKYRVDTVDTLNESWRERSFSGYDSVLHVAGIAHVTNKPGMEALYLRVNRDLAIEAASKARKEGVKQFIFMSSIIVYGDRNDLSQGRIIDRNTVPQPANVYGNSKLQAEEGLLQLANNTFKVVILRPPMIYGKGSKGNYPKLAKIARSVPCFPDVDNQRSMLYIDNLCEFIRLMVDNEETGLFYPQNEEYVRTSEMVRLIADAYGKCIRLTKMFNPLVRVMSRRVTLVNKVFGSLVYDKNLSIYKESYWVKNLQESIQITEGQSNE